MLATSQYFNFGQLIYTNSVLFIYDFGRYSSLSSNDYYAMPKLTQLISSFNEKEILLENNEWYCSECKEYQKSTKKMHIHKTPNYLILHLNRLKNNNQKENKKIINDDDNSEKNNTFVNYPVNHLDISQYVNEPKDQKEIYDLYGVIEHINSGHYKAICKNNNKWFSFDDDKIEENCVPTTENAYILFYKRKNLDKFYD